jgi:cell division protein FtsL
MNRLSLPIWLLVIVVAGFCMFEVKFAVQELEARLDRTNRQIQQDADALRVLKAEWSYLNEPDRLADLNRRHLGLAPVSARQMVELADLPVRIEPPAETPIAEASALPDAGLAAAAVDTPLPPDGPTAEDTAALAKLLSSIETKP